MSKETIAIIPCTNQKASDPGPAREVWIGAHFQLVLAHAEMFYDKVLVMSYKYGLIDPDFVIEPYNVDIRYAKAADKLKWWFALRTQIGELSKAEPLLVAMYTGNFERERIVREFVKNGVRQVIIPFSGCTVGQRMAKVYDCEPPFDKERALAGGYELPEDFGENKAEGGRYAPPATNIDTATVEWE